MNVKENILKILRIYAHYKQKQFYYIKGENSSFLHIVFLA